MLSILGGANMRKMITKGTKLFVLLLTVLLVFSSKLIIYAESETFYDYEENHIQNQGLDYYNNTSRFYSEFRIVNGVAILDMEYSGYLGVTTGAVIESKIQKKILFWWFDVNNGQANNTWVDTFSTWYGRTQHTLGISESGSYRAVIKYTISGSGGGDDIIEDIVYP